MAEPVEAGIGDDDFAIALVRFRVRASAIASFNASRRANAMEPSLWNVDQGTGEKLDKEGLRPPREAFLLRPGDFAAEATYDQLAKEIDGRRTRIVYPLRVTTPTRLWSDRGASF